MDMRGVVEHSGGQVVYEDVSDWYRTQRSIGR